MQAVLLTSPQHETEIMQINHPYHTFTTAQSSTVLAVIGLSKSL